MSPNRHTAIAIATAKQALQAALALLDAVESEQAESSPDADRMVDICQHLADAVPRRRVQDACRNGELGRKIGRKWVARISEIEHWLASQKQKPANDAADLVAQWTAGERR